MQSVDMYINYCRMKFYVPMSTGPLSSETQKNQTFYFRHLDIAVSKLYIRNKFLHFSRIS